jgi:hypothetical protein
VAAAATAAGGDLAFEELPQTASRLLCLQVGSLCCVLVLSSG